MNQEKQKLIKDLQDFAKFLGVESRIVSYKTWAVVYIGNVFSSEIPALQEFFEEKFPSVGFWPRRIPSYSFCWITAKVYLE